MGNSAVEEAAFQRTGGSDRVGGFLKMWKMNISLEGFLPRDTNGALH
jgi:hypothetical protein